MDILLNKNCIQKRISEMATEISDYYQNQAWHRYAGEPVTIICILTGAVFFMADLVRQLTIPVELDFIRASTYSGKTTKAQPTKIISPSTTRLHDAHILIIDDILDTGRTLRTVQTHLAWPYPEDIHTAVLLRKPDKAPKDIRVDFVGFDIDDKWVAGYGMDDRYGKRRAVPYVFVDEG